MKPVGQHPEPCALPYLDLGLCRFCRDLSFMVNTFLACILLRAVGTGRR